MTGDVKINNIDAFTRYGINLEDGALSTLMAPPPLKSFIENETRLSHGKRITINGPKYDSRELSLPFHIIAKSKSEFLTKYQLFCEEVLSLGEFILSTKYEPGVKYRLVYVSCSQFSQFRQEFAAFTLKVEEPDPSNRGL